MKTRRAVLVACLLVASVLVTPVGTAAPDDCLHSDPRPGNGQGNGGNNQNCGSGDGGNCGDGQGNGQGANRGQGGTCSGEPDGETGPDGDDSGDPEPIDEEPTDDGRTAFVVPFSGNAGFCPTGILTDADARRAALETCLLAPRDRDRDGIASLWTYRVHVGVGPAGGNILGGHQQDTGLGPDPDDDRRAPIPRSL